MSQTIKAPTVATNVANWTQVDNALSLDTYVASSSANPTVDTFKVGTFGGASIPGGDVIFGIEVEVWAAYQTNGLNFGGAEPLGPAKVVPDGKYVRLRAQLSKNGTVRVGSDRVLPCPATLTNIVFGGPTDLWGTTWTPSEINAGGFTVFLEKPFDLTDEWETDRYIDFARVLVYHGEAGGGGGVMPAHDKVRDICLIGKEVTPGTLVSCPIRLRKGWIDVQPDPSITEIRAAGEKLATDQVVMREKSSGSIQGRPCYDELPYLMSSRMKKPATSNFGTGLYRHIFRESNFSKDNIQTFSVEEGDLFTEARRATFCIVNSIEMNVKHDDIDLGGSVIAQAIAPITGDTMTRGVATVQTVTLTSTGTYRLLFNGEETGDLTDASNAAAIQTALRALPSVGGSTQLTVTGTGPFTVTFGNSAAGPFKGIPQPIMTSRVVSGGITVAIALTTPGGYTTVTGVPMLPGNLEVFIASSYASLSSNKVTKGFVSNINFQERASPVFYLDRAVQSYGDYAEPMDFGIEVQLELEEDSNAMAYLATARANTVQWLRLLFTGPDITVGNPHKCQIDMPFKFSNWGPYGENQAISAFTYRLKNAFDTTRNEGTVVTFENGVASY